LHQEACYEIEKTKKEAQNEFNRIEGLAKQEINRLERIIESIKKIPSTTVSAPPLFIKPAPTSAVPSVHRSSTAASATSPLSFRSSLRPTIASTTRSIPSILTTSFASTKMDEAAGLFKSTGSANGRIVYLGPRNALYYLTENFNKVYLTLNQKLNCVEYYEEFLDSSF